MTERGDLEPILPGEERPNRRARPAAERGAGTGTRQRTLAVAVMVAAVVCLVVLGLAAGTDGDRAGVDGAPPVTAPVPTSATVPSSTIAPAAPAEPLPAAVGLWRRLPSTPTVDRGVTAPVWTGSELILWTDEDRNAYRFSPEAEIYLSPLPAAPLARPRRVAAAVWTGREVIAWGYSAVQLAAAYDPVTGEWRRLPRPPLSARKPFAALWTGAEFMVWGDLDGTAGARDGAAYDPLTDRWRLISPAPMGLNEGAAVWTGEDMIVIGADLEPERSDSAVRTAMIAYNPSSDLWRDLGFLDLSPYATWAVWTGDRIVAWDYGLEAREWTPGRGWRRLDDIPLQGRECYPRGVVAGNVVLMTYCDQAAVLRPGDRWDPVVVPGKQIYTAIAAGERIIIWTNQGAWELTPGA